MAQESLDYLFKDEGDMGEALDAFAQETYNQQSTTPSLVHQYGIVAEFYIDPESKKLASMFYEARHSHKVNQFRVALPTKGHINLSTETNLVDFMRDYIAELDREGILNKLDNDENNIKEVPLGETLADGVLYRQTYDGDHTETLEKIGKVAYNVVK
jgi:hypothetical protein